jgi:hypothetical protein
MQENFAIESIEDALTQFSDRVIAHPVLESVLKDLRVVVRRPGEIPLVIVVGPTGAGKTTLVKRLYRDIVSAAAEEMAADPGFIPVVKVEAMSPDMGSFNWGDFYLRFLAAALEPMKENKSLEGSEKELRDFRKKYGTYAELRRAVEQCIRYRRIPIVIIDEAQHLTKVLNARRLQDQMDTVKSLASAVGVQFILVGTYELLPLLNQNGQLARRTRPIHFPRYRFENAKDRQSFGNILGMFESRLPIKAGGVLVQNLEYHFEHCLGCVGTLKDRIKLACRNAIESGRDHLQLQDFESIALGNDSLLQMLQEILEGERRMEARTERGDELRTKLGLQKSESSETEKSDKKDSKNRPVGERKLGRDPVGGGIC